MQRRFFLKVLGLGFLAAPLAALRDPSDRYIVGAEEGNFRFHHGNHFLWNGKLYAFDDQDDSWEIVV